MNVFQTLQHDNLADTTLIKKDLKMALLFDMFLPGHFGGMDLGLMNAFGVGQMFFMNCLGI